MRKRQQRVIILAFLSAILAFIITTVVVPPPAASAHAFVIGSNPVDGSTINAVPNVVRIDFNAPISPLSSAQIYVVRDGNLVDITGSASRIIANNPYQLETPLKDP